MSVDPSLKNELFQLLRDPAFKDFHPFLRKLQQWSSTEKYPSDIYKGLIDIFQKMNSDLHSGKSLEELLYQASEGSYVQPNWDVHSVYQSRGDIFQNVFNIFCNDIGLSVQPRIQITIVPLVMNAVEAQELASLEAFNGYSEELKSDFKYLRKRLNEQVPDWQARYQETPQLWQPFSSNPEGTNVGSIVINAWKIAESIYRDNHEPTLAFSHSFADIRTINNDRAFLKHLRCHGCVIVMDIISMCHPKILQAFQRSLLDAFPHTFVMTFSPDPEALNHIQQITTDFQFCLSDLEFFKRKSDVDEDFGTCVEVSKEVEFQQWLKDRLWKTIDRRKAFEGKKEKGILGHFNQFNRGSRRNA